MALDNQLTQIQTIGISSNISITGVTTVTTLNASNISVTGILTASTSVVTSNLSASGNITASGSVSATGNVSSGSVTINASSQNITGVNSVTSSSGFFNTQGHEAATFPSGTALLFYQASAPTGWTKSTSHNDKALRVVSGSGGGSGGSTAFSTVMASRTPGGSVSGTNSSGAVSNTTISEAQMPSHQHGTTFNGADDTNPPRNVGNMTVWADNAPFSGTAYSDYRGSSNSHGHGFTNPTWSGTFTGTAMDFAVQYVDVIICSKN